MNMFKKIGLLVTVFSSFGCFAMTDLHEAAWAGGIARVQTLIVAGANVNVQDLYGSTPLHHATTNGRLEVVQALIAAGANVNTQNMYGLTPLHYAAFSGHLEVVQAFIAAGANIHAQNNNGETPVQVAGRRGHTAIVDYINAYMQRIQEVQARAPMIRYTLAMATHPRLGAESLLRMLPQHLLHDIAYLTTQAELHDAAQPK